MIRVPVLGLVEISNPALNESGDLVFETCHRTFVMVKFDNDTI